MSSELTKNTDIQIAELNQQIKILQEELNFILNKFENCYVDTREDFRILNYLGATDVIFFECDKKFEKGENLVKMINRITKTNIAHIEGEENTGDSIPSIDSVVAKFVHSERKEISLKVMGEKNDGELFLLSWHLKKYEKFVRHFIKIQPSNQIVKLSQEKHTHDLVNFKELFRNLINLLEIGVVILDVTQRIRFINETAKLHILPNQNNFNKKANFENKHFKDLIFMTDQEDMNFRLDTNKSVMDTKRIIKYERVVNEQRVYFQVHPTVDKTNTVAGLAILSRVSMQSAQKLEQKSMESQVDVRKLLLTVKHYTNQNKSLSERINELETNQKWLMKNGQSYESTIKSLYSHFDNIPYPIEFVEMPDQKIEMVNSTFVQALKIDKKNILGKTDFDIFPPKIAEQLSKYNDDCSKDNVLISHVVNNNFSYKQAPFMDFGNNKIIVARVFHLTNNTFNFDEE